MITKIKREKILFLYIYDRSAHSHLVHMYIYDTN